MRPLLDCVPDVPSVSKTVVGLLFYGYVLCLKVLERSLGIVDGVKITTKEVLI